MNVLPHFITAYGNFFVLLGLAFSLLLHFCVITAMQCTYPFQKDHYLATKLGHHLLLLHVLQLLLLVI